jgi:polyphosphate kinase
MTISASGEDGRASLSVLEAEKPVVSPAPDPQEIGQDAKPSGPAAVEPVAGVAPLSARAPTSVPAARPDSAEPAVAPETPTFDLDAPEYYLNRELTWLDFNRRVLHEAEDERTPLLERMKFLAIVAANLDEFFMKRIGGLKQQVGAGVSKLTVDGRTPEQQIDECHTVVREIEAETERLLPELLEALEKHGIAVLPYESLSDSEREKMRAHYIENIFPLVTPQAVDSAHPFPFISNLSLNLLVTLGYSGEDDEEVRARVKVPIGPDIPRLIPVGDSKRFVPLEQVMSNNLDLLFPKMDIRACELFHVTRNANTDRDEERAAIDASRQSCGSRWKAPWIRSVAACWPLSSASTSRWTSSRRTACWPNATSCSWPCSRIRNCITPPITRSIIRSWIRRRSSTPYAITAPC